MFRNIGRKIKIVARVLCYFGMAVSVILGIVLWVELGKMVAEMNRYGYNSSGLNGFTVFLIGLAAMAFGTLLSWLNSFVFYGFGELVDSNAATRESQAEILRILQRQNGITPAPAPQATPKQPSNLAPAAKAVFNTAAQKVNAFTATVAQQVNTFAQQQQQNFAQQQQQQQQQAYNQQQGYAPQQPAPQQQAPQQQAYNAPQQAFNPQQQAPQAFAPQQQAYNPAPQAAASGEGWYCKRCGTRNNAGDTVCAGCGNPK